VLYFKAYSYGTARTAQLQRSSFSKIVISPAFNLGTENKRTVSGLFNRSAIGLRPTTYRVDLGVRFTALKEFEIINHFRIFNPISRLAVLRLNYGYFIF